MTGMNGGEGGQREMGGKMGEGVTSKTTNTSINQMPIVTSLSDTHTDAHACTHTPIHTWAVSINPCLILDLP